MCNGICRTGLQCQREHWLDSEGFCRDHKDQSENYTPPVRVTRESFPFHRLTFHPTLKKREVLQRVEVSTAVPMDFEWSSRDTFTCNIVFKPAPVPNPVVPIPVFPKRAPNLMFREPAPKNIDLVIARAEVRRLELDIALEQTMRRVDELEKLN
jgi:hypothetical protein